MICKVCNTPMKHIISFSKRGNYDYYRCPKCYIETKKTPFSFFSYNNIQENKCNISYNGGAMTK